METIYLQKTKELRNNLSKIEREFNIKITVEGRKVTIDGDPINEYEAKEVIEAIGFGFSAKKALLLKGDNMEFRKIPIKSYTRRKNLYDVKSRIIGTKGKTKRTIEEITNCFVELNNNTVGIICPLDTMEEALTGLKNVIRGTKQSNVYRYLERMNRERKSKT